MTIWQSLTNLFRPAAGASPNSAPTTHARRLAGKRANGGRRARETVNQSGELVFGRLSYVEPPPDHESQWRVQDLDSRTLSRISPARLVELLADLSPEISRALFDFIRMFNPGHELTALQADGETLDERATTALAEFETTLKALYGSFDVVLSRLIFGGFMRGAFFGEVVLDRRGRLPIDFATPDPFSARFKKEADPDRGEIWRLGQWVNGEFRRLDDVPTVRYVPIDPAPNSPYGRAPVAPALFTTLFLTGLLHDLRRVVAQQGYPRIVVTVNLEKLANAAPETAPLGSSEFENWVTATVDEIERVFASLEPDDAYITTDVVEVKNPVGAVDASSLGGIDALLATLERMAIRALKTIPLLLGVSEGAGETHANRQWEIYAAGIKSIQHLLESMLESLFTVALEAQGIQATVRFRFGELRASELLRDAQTEAMQIANEKAKYEAGWTSQDEASEAITGHPADEEEPRRQPAPSFGFGPDLIQGDGENEEVEETVDDEEDDRARLLAEIRAARAEVAQLIERQRNGRHA